MTQAKDTDRMTEGPGAQGDQWLNVCVRCGQRKTTYGPELPGECPGCQGSRWLCHLLNEAETAQESQISGDKATDHVNTGSGILSQPDRLNKMTETVELTGSKDLEHPEDSESSPELEPMPESGRGRKPRPMPGDLIKRLSGQGCSSRQIAEELDRRGFHASYRTIQRHLARQKQLHFG